MPVCRLGVGSWQCWEMTGELSVSLTCQFRASVSRVLAPSLCRDEEKLSKSLAHLKWDQTSSVLVPQKDLAPLNTVGKKEAALCLATEIKLSWGEMAATTLQSRVVLPSGSQQTLSSWQNMDSECRPLSHSEIPQGTSSPDIASIWFLAHLMWADQNPASIIWLQGSDM